MNGRGTGHTAEGVEKSQSGGRWRNEYNKLDVHGESMDQWKVVNESCQLCGMLMIETYQQMWSLRNEERRRKTVLPLFTLSDKCEEYKGWSEARYIEVWKSSLSCGMSKRQNERDKANASATMEQTSTKETEQNGLSAKFRRARNVKNNIR